MMIGGNSSVGGASTQPSPRLALWPSFSNWPTRGAHVAPNLTMANIEYNYPQAIVMSTPGGPPVPALDSPLALTDEGPMLAAQLFSVGVAARPTRADIVIWRQAGRGPADVAGDPRWAESFGEVSYSVVECDEHGLPDLTQVVLCKAGCALAPAETTTVAQPLPLYLDPTEAELRPHRQYAFVLRWWPGVEDRRASKEASNASGYLLGCSATRSTKPSKGTLLLVANAPSGGVTSWKRYGQTGYTQQQLMLTLYIPSPPSRYNDNQMHADWVSFRAAVMAGFVRTCELQHKRQLCFELSVGMQR